MKRDRIRSFVEGYLNWSRNRSDKVDRVLEPTRYMEPLEPRVLLSSLPFDPTGAGSNFVPLVTIDWQAGNSIATGADPYSHLDPSDPSFVADDPDTVGGSEAITNFVLNELDDGDRPVQFMTYYQATMSRLTGEAGVELNLPITVDIGSGVLQEEEMTIVVGFGQRVVGVEGALEDITNNPISATFAWDEGLPSFFEIWHDDTNATRVTSGPTAQSNVLIGQGYNDQTLIMSAELQSVNQVTFTIEAVFDENGDLIPLDQSDTINVGNQYPGISTVVGQGETQLSAAVDFFHQDWFDVVGNPLFNLTFLNNLGFNVPFRQADPNSGFATTPGGVEPNLSIGPDNVDATNTVGNINGGPLLVVVPGQTGDNGPDFVVQTDATQSFELIDPAMLGDYVWDDKNANGIQDAEDLTRGIAGVEVKLLADLDDDGQIDDVVATILTSDGTTDYDNDGVLDTVGFYKFNDLVPGVEYQVMFTNPDAEGPDAYMFSPRQAGGDPAVDSDGPMSDVVVLAPGEYNDTIDAGLFRKGSIHAFGFLDEDGDGVLDDNEGAFPDEFGGKTFELLDENLQLIETMNTTGMDGQVWFEGLVPGTYFVQENPVPDGFILTTLPNLREFTVMSGVELVYKDGAAMLPDGDSREEMNLGDELVWGNAPLAMLGDYVWDDKNANGIQDAEDLTRGIAGVEVKLLADLDDDGQIDDVVATILTSDGTTDYDNDGVLDTVGFYKFNNLVPGVEYQVMFTNPDAEGPDAYMFSPRQAGGDPAVDSDGPMSDVVVLAPGEYNDTIDAGLFRKGSIHAFGFLDEDGDGVLDDNEGAFPDEFGGKTFELLDENLQLIETMNTTGMDGQVWFEGLVPGTYFVQENPVPDGFILTTLPNLREFTVMSGVELVYKDGAAMLPDGDSREEMNLGDELVWGNAPLAMLGDYVWDDKNANGIQDAEDLTRGIAGVEVKLLADLDDDGQIDDVVATILTSDGTTDYDNDGVLDTVGFYKFNDLVPGVEYQVMFTNPDAEGPDAYMFSPRQAGGDPAVDSDGPMSDVVVLAPGEYNDTIDAGLFRKGSIHAFGFLDEDGDGVLDDNEGAFPDEFGGKTFELLDENLQLIETMNTTGMDGQVWFEGLVPGTYFVQENPVPDGFILTTLPNLREFTVMSGVELVYKDGAAMLPDGDSREEMNLGDELVWGNMPLNPEIDLEKFVKIVRQVDPEFEGLTPGFWKTHSEYGPAPLKGWPETGFDPDDSYEAIFGVDVPGDPTLLEALGTGGGGINALLRHSTAALLNAAHPSIEYNLTVAEVIEATKEAIESGDATQIEDLKDQFDTWNNQGADLSDGGGSGGGEMIMFGPDDADDAPGLEAQIGDQVMYLYSVTNTGDVALNIDSLIDDNATPDDPTDDFTPDTVDEDMDGFNDGDTDMDGLLDPGETWLFQTDFSTITDTGEVCNLAVVTATSVPGGLEVSDEDPACYHVPEDPNDGQGLTPGFWKQPQHFVFWVSYTQDDLFDDVFGVTNSLGGDLTLLEALETGGGGEVAMMRHAVAALLNAANPDVDYAFTEMEIISMVQAAYVSGDFDGTKNLFEEQNELGNVDLKDIEEELEVI